MGSAYVGRCHRTSHEEEAILLAQNNGIHLWPVVVGAEEEHVSS